MPEMARKFIREILEHHSEKVVPLNAPEAGQVKRLGFMAGQVTVPDDFDRMGASAIEQLFGGDA